LNNPPLSEKEFEIINIIADGFRSNQRDLSDHLDLSLGMTNLLLRRLVTKGYLRIKQLNRKKVEYLLTPRGIAEKAQKTYNYTLKTIESFGLIKEVLRQVLIDNLKPETTQIIVAGDGDLADLTQLLLLDVKKNGVSIKKTSYLPDNPEPNTLVLSAITGIHPADDNPSYIDLLRILAEKVNFRRIPTVSDSEDGISEAAS